MKSRPACFAVAVAEISAAAARIGPYTLNVRLPEQDLPAEISPIVRAVNSALQRLDDAAEEQRDFQRKAAHQLRTPMMVLGARVASLDQGEATAQLRGDVQELSRLLSQLLQLNEINWLREGDAAADLGAVGEAVQAEFADRHGIGVALVRPGAPVLVGGDPNVIEVAVRNLVENAVQHSPPDGAVEIQVGPEGSIGVADAGPGIAAELRRRIFEPFWSGDPERRLAGLGLTIVKRIADKFGASATVETPPGGGCLIVLRFRPPPPGFLASNPAATTIPASLTLRLRAQSPAPPFATTGSTD